MYASRGSRFLPTRTFLQKLRSSTVYSPDVAVRQAGTVSCSFNSPKTLLSANLMGRESRRTKIWSSPFPPVEVTRTNLHQKLMTAIDKHITNDPDNIALVAGEDANVKMTFSELKEQSTAAAAYLNSIGLTGGDVATLVVGNCLPVVPFYMGVIACDAAISGAPPMFTVDELQHQLAHSNSKVILTDDSVLETVMAASKQCANVKHIICIRNNKERPLPNGVIDWQTAVNFKGPLPQTKATCDDVVAIPYSSGTTGRPKGVVLTNQAIGTAADLLICHYERQLIPKLFEGEGPWDWTKEAQMLQLPFYHIYGLVTLNQSLMTGMTGIVFKQFDPVMFMAANEKYKVKHLMTVPPILEALVKHPAADKFDQSYLRVVNSGGSPLHRDLAHKFQEKYPKCYLNQGYGMSEMALASHLPLIDDLKAYMSCAVASNCEMKIVDKNGRELGAGERGEICVRSPGMMKGYLNNEKATKEAIIDQWFHTGDIGYANEIGEVFLDGRKSEMIHVNGVMVAPAELDELLLSCDGVVDAAVIGVPHEKFGEVPKAFVVRKAPVLTETKVIKFVEERLDKPKWLVGGVQFVDAIPKANSGKIYRRVLREMEAKTQKKKARKMNSR